MGTKVFDNALDLITFSRASGGTSLRKISYGSELAISPTTTNDWIDNGDGSYSITSASSNSFLNAATVENGKIYLISFVSTGDTLTVRCGGAASGVNYPSGTYSVIRVGSGNGLVSFIAGIGETATVDNISVKEVLFDQPDGTLTLFNHPDNIPRIDYNPDGTVKGLLIEEQRVNNVTNSEACDFNASGVGDVSVTVSETSAPFGANSVVKRLQASTENDGARLGVQILTSGDNHCSVYVRSRTGADQNIKITTSGTVGSTQVVPASGEWVRLGRTASLGAGSRDMRILSIGDPIDVDIAWPQIELGSFPTSYIPTEGIAKTRSADIASIPVTDFGYNQKAGTVVVDVESFGSTASNPMAYQINDSTTSNRLTVYGSATAWSFRSTVNGLTEGAVSAGSFDDTKIASSFALNKFNLCVGGVLGVEDTSGLMPSVTNFSLGNQTGANQLNGHIKSIQYYPRRLSNTQLQELTS